MFNEMDVVRTRQEISGTHSYMGYPVSIPAGTDGAVLLGGPGQESVEVEFVWPDPARPDDMFDEILDVPVEMLDLVMPASAMP